MLFIPIYRVGSRNFGRFLATKVKLYVSNASKALGKALPAHGRSPSIYPAVTATTGVEPAFERGLADKHPDGIGVIEFPDLARHIAATVAPPA